MISDDDNRGPVPVGGGLKLSPSVVAIPSAFPCPFSYEKSASRVMPVSRSTAV